MKILAVDPGYEKVGIAVMEKEGGPERLLFSECFKTNRTSAPEERLALIGAEIRRVISSYAPEALSIEELFFNTNQKTALRVSEARGVIVYAAASAGLRVRGYTPLEVKIALTGYGRSGKKQVTEMAKRLVKIDKKIAEDDEYDAIAIGLTFFASEKMNTVRERN